MTVPSNDDEEQNTEQQLLSMLDTQLLSLDCGHYVLTREGQAR